MRDDEPMNHSGDDRIDRQIDAALRSYAEPSEIPEAREILARLMERARSEQVRPQRARAKQLRRTPWWVWAAIPACALLMAALITAWMLRGPRVPEIAWSPRTPGVVAPVRGAKEAVKFHPAVRNRAVRHEEARAKLPRLDVFPSPRPLTPQEQALVAFVQHGPPEVQRAVLEDQKRWDDPIIVAGLQEQPLQAGERQDQ